LQPKSLDKATELFDHADTNNDGKLTLKELAGVLKSASQEYSHLAEHVRFLDGYAYLLHLTASALGAKCDCAVAFLRCLLGIQMPVIPARMKPLA